MANELLTDFLALTDQFAKDIESEYNAYQDEKEAIGEDVEEIALKAVIDEVKAAADEHFDNMLALTKTYLQDIKELPQGEHPAQTPNGE